MNPLILKYGPYYFKDKNGCVRGYGWLLDGTYINYARLIMMNFLHTKKIPKVFHVHHENEITDDDRIENLRLLSISQHISLHNPRDYKYGISKADNAREYEKNRAMLDPNFKQKRKVIDTKHRNSVKNDPQKKLQRKQQRHEYWLIKRQEPGFLEALRIKSSYYRSIRKGEANATY